MKDLGYANGWKKTPKEVKDCPHIRDIKDIRKHIVKVTCNICGYMYKVDSSD